MAPCPAGRYLDGGHMIEFKKILVPTDFSADSRRALKTAQDLAGMFDAEIVVVHVLEPPVYPAMTFGAGAATLPHLVLERGQGRGPGAEGHGRIHGWLEHVHDDEQRQEHRPNRVKRAGRLSTAEQIE